MKKRIAHILFKPLILSLPFAIAIILLLPPVFGRYRAKLIKKEIVASTTKKIFHDFDHDGESEELWLMTEQSEGNIFSTVLIHVSGLLIDQPSLPGDFRPSRPYLFGDYDNNGIDEFYVTTHCNDSIFLNMVEPVAENGVLKHIKHKVKYICNYPLDKRGNIDYMMDAGGVEDLNCDGKKEIVFTLRTSWSGQPPRNTFAFDIKNDTVLSSPYSGSAIYYPIIYDIDGDRFPEIVGNAHAFENCKDFPYSDTCTWLMVLDHKLHFLFDPIRIGTLHAWLQVTPFRVDTLTFLAALNIERSPGTPPSSIMLFNKYGKKIVSQPISQELDIESSYLITCDALNRNLLYILIGNGIIEQFDRNLNLFRKLRMKVWDFGLSLVAPYEEDLDLDGNKEFLIPTKDHQKIILARNDFTYPTIIDVPILDTKWFDFSIKENKDKRPELYIQCDQSSYLFSYAKNPLYYLRFLIYAGIYAGFLLFIWLIQKTQQYRLKQKYAIENEIAGLQMKSIQNQIDPHFTFNILNSLGALFYKNDPEKANYLFSKYGKLLRNTILNSDNIAIPLFEEIDYITNYMELEKYRTDDKFDYKIEIDKDVDMGMKIPKMIMHTFIENAIKHGLKPLQKKGRIDITIKAENRQMTISISDNGIGREKAQQSSQESTGRGLNILNQILDLYFKLYKIKIRFDITDLYDSSDQPIGTSVDILIPINT